MGSCLRVLEKTAGDNFVKIQPAFIALRAKIISVGLLLVLYSFRQKKKEKRGKTDLSGVCGLSISGLITGCSWGPKPKQCFCIWEDVWSLSWCAGTCITRLSVFSTPFFSIVLFVWCSDISAGCVSMSYSLAIPETAGHKALFSSTCCLRRWVDFFFPCFVFL